MSRQGHLSTWSVIIAAARHHHLLVEHPYGLPLYPSLRIGDPHHSLAASSFVTTMSSLHVAESKAADGGGTVSVNAYHKYIFIAQRSLSVSLDGK